MQPVLCRCSVYGNVPHRSRNKRQERCSASLESGIFTGCPRGPEPPGHKAYNVLDVVVCLFAFFVDDSVSGKIENLGKTQWKQPTCESMANIVSLPTTIALKNTASTSCKDKNAKCGPWACRGECCKNPAYMLEHCCAACKAKGNRVIFIIASSFFNVFCFGGIFHYVKEARLA